MTTLPKINRRGWLALYLQSRRRVRAARATLLPVTVWDELVAHFAFEEVSGNRVDDVAAAVLEPQAGAVDADFGMFGFGANLTGTGWLLSAETVAFSPTAQGFAVSVWANFSANSDPNTNCYFGVWADTTWPTGASWLLYATPGADAVNGQMMSPTVGYDYIGGSADLSQWVHICLVYDPAELWTLYLNGVAVDTLAMDCQPESGRLGVGGRYTMGDAPNEGLFDELAFWSRALSADEVGQLYNDGAGLAYPY